MSSTSDQPKPKTVIERTYSASVIEMWNLWTTKEGFTSWWGPQGFRVEVRKLDAKVGGSLEYEMIADSPEMVQAMKKMGQPTSHQVHSEFSVYSPHTKLTLTNVIDFLPGVAPYQSHITVEFIPVDQNVRMVVTLDAMHSDEFTKMQIEGFTSQLTKLNAKLAT